MRFNSLIYIAFFAAALATTWALPFRARKAWLVALSCLFYASWRPPYLALLLSAAVVNHLGSRWIAAADDRRRRGMIVVALNLAPLIIFKYLGWLSGLASGPLSSIGFELHVPHWLLPLGISFYLFECISYTIDVVRKREKPHPFIDFLFFIAFFPKLIAGPILRAKELLPQLARHAAPDPGRVAAALRLLVSGLFIKTVLADGIGLGVDAAFSKSADRLGALDAWVMAFGFGLQIYFDFSSYSRMAIGSARLLGFELVENFDHPYAAKSPAEFWARWHMSLSRWIRDYLFYPMVGRSTSLASMVRAAILSMTLCGLWHGAGWGYLLWGLWHGILVAGYHVVTFKSRGKPTPPLAAWVGRGVTLASVMIGWLFFRATTAADGLRLFRRAFDPYTLGIRSLPGTFYLEVAVLMFAVLVAAYVAPRVAKWLEQPRQTLAGLVEGAAWGALLAIALVYLHGQTAFIYFQF